jgi:S-adenosylmethionine:tRNA ribosyltransferase-isomerase
VVASVGLYAPSDYSFELDPALIAQEPAARREDARLLHLDGSGAVADHLLPDLVELLPRGAVVVVNDTRVIPARVLGKKDTGGGSVELLFLAPEPAHGPSAWRALARARRPLRAGQHVTVGDVAVELVTGRDADGSVVVAVPGDVVAFLDRHGHVPLPRYIRRSDRDSDRDRYQTMFAREPGAIAAPTAGLHLTPPLVDAMRARDITIAPLTLHVGYGTFEPVHASDLREHRMHAERYAIPDATAELVASGRPVVAIGTTALRALEAAALAGARAGTTDLFIYPGSGHAFRVVDHLVTNFHLPESTLLMLVCAFAGTERVLAAYAHATSQRYRFFSYGDAMLCHRAPR